MFKVDFDLFFRIIDFLILINQFVSSIENNTRQSVVELSLNAKNCIIFSDRREEKIIQFFVFKVDSTIGWRVLFSILLI